MQKPNFALDDDGDSVQEMDKSPIMIGNFNRQIELDGMRASSGLVGVNDNTFFSEKPSKRNFPGKVMPGATNYTDYGHQHTKIENDNERSYMNETEYVAS